MLTEAQMGLANVKLDAAEIAELKKYTKEKTGQKAVEKALIYFLRDAKQRNILNVLKDIDIRPNYDPLKLRNYER